MIRHEHFNTYMEWKFKSLRIWPSEKSIDREFRLRHFWKFFWDNNQKSFWDSRQMFTLNHPVHHNDKSIATIIRNNLLWNRFHRIWNKVWHQPAILINESGKKHVTAASWCSKTVIWFKRCTSRPNIWFRLFFIDGFRRNKSLTSRIGKLTICLRAEVTLIGTDFNVRRGVSIDNIARKGNNFLRYQLHTKIYVSTFYIVEYHD